MIPNIRTVDTKQVLQGVLDTNINRSVTRPAQ